MRKRSARKSSAAALLELPQAPPAAKVDAPSTAIPSQESPMLNFAVKFDGFSDIAKSLKSKSDRGTKPHASASKPVQATGISLSPIGNVNTISDLKGLANSNLCSLKRQLEKSHREILKDFESTQTRLQKRYKMQTHACQQMMDEAEKEYKKLSDRITEGQEAMKASYGEFLAEAHATTSRLCKTSIPELAKTAEKSIDSLRHRFGISADAA